MTSSWHGRVSAQEGRSPLHDIANSGRHRNGYCGADFNYPHGENSLSFFQTVEVGLKVTIGVLAILHTWGQELLDHPHLHFLVTGGGLSLDGARAVTAVTAWIEGSANYFLPGQILMEVFRAKFLDYLGDAYEEGKLIFPGKIAQVGERGVLPALLREMKKKLWNVKTKKPFPATSFKGSVCEIGQAL